MRWRLGERRAARQAETQQTAAEQATANGPSPYDAALTDDPHQTWDQYLRAEFGVEPDADREPGQ